MTVVPVTLHGFKTFECMPWWCVTIFDFDTIRFRYNFFSDIKFGVTSVGNKVFLKQESVLVKANLKILFWLLCSHWRRLSVSQKMYYTNCAWTVTHAVKDRFRHKFHPQSEIIEFRAMNMIEGTLFHGSYQLRKFVLESLRYVELMAKNEYFPPRCPLTKLCMSNWIFWSASSNWD